MERHGDPTGSRAASDSAGRNDDTVDHDHPASSEQTGSSFGEGYDQKPDTTEETQGSDFARGMRSGPSEELEHKGRFSDGIDQKPDPPEELVERRFSEGIERSPTSD